MATDVSTILQLTVPLIVQIGCRRMKLDEVLALGPGAIVELEKAADSDLELMVNNKAVGAGVAVKVSENFGLRLKRVGSAAQRIEAMGEDEAEQ